MRSLFVVVSWVCLYSTAAHAQERLTDEHDVLALIGAYDRAWQARDSAAVDGWLAPGFIYVGSQQNVRDRPQILAFLARPSYTIATARREVMEVHFTGETAVATSRWIGTGNLNGRPHHQEEFCTLTVAHIGDRWVVAAEHCQLLSQTSE